MPSSIHLENAWLSVTGASFGELCRCDALLRPRYAHGLALADELRLQLGGGPFGNIFGLFRCRLCTAEVVKEFLAHHRVKPIFEKAATGQHSRPEKGRVSDSHARRMQGVTVTRPCPGRALPGGLLQSKIVPTFLMNFSLFRACKLAGTATGASAGSGEECYHLSIASQGRSGDLVRLATPLRLQA